MNNLVNELVEAGILLEVKDGKLKMFSANPTINEDLVNKIRENKQSLIDYLNAKSQKTNSEIYKADIADLYPVSYAQKRMWILSQQSEASLAYSMPMTFNLNNEIDIEKFEKAIGSVIKKHEILRTVFIQKDLEVFQKVVLYENSNFKLRFIDLSNSKDSEDEFKKKVQFENSIIFDLENGPLLKAILFKLSDAKYIFYYNMHHIISDGWSQGIIIKDTLAFYESYSNENLLEISELDIQYKDFTLWQIEEFKKNQSRHISFFETYLEGDLPRIQLPGTTSRPKIKSYNGTILKALLPVELTDKVHLFCKENDSTLFNFYYALFNVLLYKYTYETDLVIGTPIAGRSHHQLQNQIGCYINTMVLRTKLDPEAAFIDNYKSIKANVQSVFEHENYPFDCLVEDLDIKSDPSRSLLFDILFVYQNFNENNTKKETVRNEGVQNLGESKSKLDLEIVFIEEEGSLSLNINYNVDLYTGEVITSLMNHFIKICKVVIENPKIELKNITFLSESEQMELLNEFNTTTVPYPKDKTVVELFEEQVRKNPKGIAVIAKDTFITYEELNARSNRLGAYLREKYDVVPDDIVGVALQRSETLILAIYGILKAGAAYVPIDPKYPGERRSYIEQNSKCKLVIDDSFINQYETESDRYSTNNLEINCNPNSLLYTIYTSGTTGNPKGVMIENHSLINRLIWMQKAYSLDESDVILQKTTFTFDVSVWELFWWGIFGSKVCLLAPDKEKEPSAIIDTIASNKVTVMHFVPSMLSSFLEYLVHFPDEIVKLKSLKQVFTSGEALSKTDSDLFFDLLPEVSLMNLYGPTEASIDVTYYDCGTKRYDQIIPIGKPIDNTQILILDSYGNMVPKGVKGKLYIAGVGLARGYLNNDKLTKEKFINNPFKKNELIYDTGDVAEWLEDGNINFLGRIDDQVKIRGFRIELGEIEYHLKSKKDIDTAVVLAKETTDGEKSLVAYIVSQKDQNVSDLRNFLMDKLPNYMIPSQFIQIEQIPLSASGKANKKELLASNQAELTNNILYVEAESIEEKALIEVCKGILNKEKISINDSFYNVGGDSIKSIQIVSRLKQMGYALKVEDVLRTPIFKELAALLKTDVQKIDQSEVFGKVDLTPIQHYLFDTFELPHHFNQSILLKSKNPVNVELLRQSLIMMLTNHDALRMTFNKNNDEWEQINGSIETIDLQIPTYDLTTSHDPLNELKVIAEELQSSFNLSNGSLIRVGHFKLNDGDRIAIIIHHLVVDGVSWRILIEDLFTLYKQGLANETFKLPLKTDSFQRWALLQKEYAYSDEVLSEAKYWETICEKNIATIKTFDKRKEQNKEKIDFSLDAKSTQLLQTNFHQIYNTEINDVLLTGLGLAIKEIFNCNQTILKMEGHGREEIIDKVDISRTVGWFSTFYPVVLDLTNTGDAVTVLTKVKDDLRKIPNKGIGFGILKYLNESYNHLSFSPSVLFNFLGDFDTSFKSDNNDAEFVYSAESMGQNISKENTDDVLLDVSGSIVSGKLYMSVTFDTASFVREEILSLMAAYKKYLTDLIQNVSSKKHSSKTPSDLTFSDLTSKELELINSDGNIEDVYELSPLQKGIYFHWLTNSSKSLYFEQISYKLKISQIGIDVIADAYQKLVDSHSVLRTHFNNDLVDIPLQIVRKEVKANFIFDEVDPNLKGSSLDDYIEKYKIEDREEGFNLSDDSLMRLKVLSLGNNQFEFIWSHHHILMDGWCMSKLIGDFNLILKAINQGIPADIPKPKPYSDYIKWLRKINTVDSFAYWKNQLQDYSNSATIPFVKQKVNKEYSDSIVALKIDGKLFKQIDELCKKISVTQNVFLQTAWGVLLSKYSNDNDVVFGSVVSGRPAHLNGVENMIGLFINTIPVRVKYANESTAIQLLEEIQKEAIDSNSHHYVSLAKIQSQSESDSSLINHIMIFENFPIEETVSASGSDIGTEEKITIESVGVFEQTNYDFNIIVVPSKESLQIQFKFNSNKFDEELMHRLSMHYSNVVNYFVDSANKAIGDVDCITDDEKEIIFNRFNATQTDFRRNQKSLFSNTNKENLSNEAEEINIFPEEKEITLLDLYKVTVSKFPNKSAVSCSKSVLSYSELDTLTSQLANYLRTSYDVQSNDLVGIKLERSSNMLVAIVGILKAGGAYVPVDTSYPEERLEYIKSDSGYKLCIDDEFLKTFEIEKDNYAKTVEGISVSGSSMAYAIYTSGSTGNPKGVLNKHSGLYNRLLWMRDALKISPEDVILQKTPYTFDVSVWELLMPSITGSCLVFAEPEGHKDPSYLQDLIERSQISIMHFVPSMLGIFLEELDAEKCRSLKHVVCSGEALPGIMVEEFKQKLPWVHIHNLYGPTEAAIDVTYIDLTNVDTNESGVTIGKPVANTKIYIVDRQMSLQPIGVPGELLIEGVQVAQGYLNRPELNAEKFIVSPFNEGERIYRTGDLAKWLANGEIAYIGRIDNQVKIRGNRIELGEIETRILESGFVDNVAVLVKGEELARKYLVAYVVPKEGYQQEDLYTYLKGRLPEYMLPGVVIEMDSFPLTSSGKLDRKLLPESNQGDLFSESFQAPRNQIESELAAIWGEVLKLDKISIHDNFFRIGGDSIVSIRLISKINKAIKIKITIGDLYENNTIEALSNLIVKTEGISNQDDRLCEQIIEKVEKLKYEVLNVIEDSDLIEDIYPMHDIQKGMVLLSSINPTIGIYHDQFVFQIPKVNLQLFEQALSKLVDKHSILRTYFDLVNYSEEIQIVRKEIDFKITQLDIQTLNSKEQEEFINNFMISERKTPFDIKTAPLWRINLFTVSPFNEVLLFQFHHSILDGWSVASLYTELFQIYKQLSNNLKYQINYLKSSNKDAIIGELFKNNGKKNIEFWRNEIKNVQNLNIFNNKSTYQQFSKSYDIDIKEKLQKKCKEDQITLKTLIYGALVYTIKLLSTENDFMIGLVGNNRPSIEDGDKLLGCFLNTIPVRNILNDIDNISWKKYFRIIDDKLISLKSYEDLTFFEINKLANTESGNQSQLINILFNYVDFHIYDELETNVVDKKDRKNVQNYLNIRSHESANTYFDIDVNASGAMFVLNYTLQREFKNDLTLERIHKFMDKIILSYIDTSENIVGKTSLISNEEEHEILSFFNKPSTKYSQSTILELFSQSVRNKQSNKAIVDSRTTFTYGQLDKEVNQFANFLKNKFEISNGDIVGVELNNNCSMIVSFLAILKTGGVYLPIDIDYSASRKELIYADSNCKVVIQDQILQNFRDSKDEYKDDFEMEVDPDDTAYIIYTSGSTGKPKGVPILHKSLVDYVLTFKNYFNISSNDSIVQQASTSFDTSIEEIFPILISGGLLVMNESRKDINHLLDLCEKHSVTILSTNPFIIQYINEVYYNYNFKFRVLISGGDVLKPKYIDKIWNKIKTYNTYGPTESTVCATYHEIEDLNDFISIGKPINNRQIYIFSPKSNHLMPIGLFGEICIGGEGLSLGYLNNEDLTSEKFIDNPYKSETKLYRTGDLGRWLPDGSIEFLGRSDSQVKIRGFRIELEEIELAILNSGYVKNAATLTIGDEENKRIVAFVVPLEEYSKENIMNYLSAHLPEYMLPSLILSKETLPLTINGKLDKKALEMPNIDSLLVDTYEPPSNDVERKLIAIWKNLLHVNKIGIHDNFFEIGGNSLMVVKLQNDLQKEFETLINIVELFNNVTVKKQAFILQKKLKIETEEEFIKSISF
jgi:amino acid adenylation domain-containing protein/non-ribosomal peptide synthase protein (TIGR01720 family)